MTSSNNNNYVFKCYLNVFTIVLAKIGSNALFIRLAMLLEQFE